MEQAAARNVHFLHIGKTGGTAVKHALRDHLSTPGYTLHLHPHETTLRDIPTGEKAMFFLRDPLERFISGFYSRQRQGQPRYFSPWSPEEKVAFERFPTPDVLGRALSSPIKETKEHAVQAMRAIQHVRNSFWNWFGDERYYRSRQADIFFIGFQDSLAADFEELKISLGLPEHLTLPQNDVTAHRNPKGLDRTMSAEAQMNLRGWYAADYAFMDICRDQRRTMIVRANGA